jgi:hypothetical protein
VRFNPGLQARLALAFAAVAILAIAANLLAERTVRVVVERVWNPPAPQPAPAPLAVAAPAPPAEPVAAIELPAKKTVTLRRDEFATAIEDYERAVQSRIAADEAAVQRQLDSSSATLLRRARDLQSDLKEAQIAQRRALAQELDALQMQAQAMIEQSDQRRAAFRDYASTIETLTTNARARLDGAWRILGRVIARQQLVEPECAAPGPGADGG